MVETVDRLPVARADLNRLWIAVVTTGLFMLSAIVQGAFRPDYDGWHQAVSALSLGPAGWIQQVSFVMLGAALLGTAPVWWRILAGGRGARAYPLLTAITGLSFVVIAWFPQDPAPGYDPERLGHTLPTTTGLMHLAIAGVAAACSCAALFVMGSRLARLPQWRGWSAYSYGSGVLTIVCVAVYAAWSTQPSGLAGTFERLAVLVPGAWGYGLVARLSAGTPIGVRRENHSRRSDTASAA
jgi:hypothetical protein